MTKFQYSAWQNLLREAANETDSGRLSEKVQEAETARAPGESSGISRTRAGAVFVHVTGF